jgi:Protein of unknown function (DUF3592)
MKTIAILKYAFAAIGLVLLAGALFWIQQTRWFLNEAIVAEGTVVDLVRSGGDSTYRPVVRFRAAGSREVEFTSGAGTNPPAYSRGEKVEVLYRPSKLEDASIKGFVSLWLGPTIVGGLGAVFFAIGASMIVFGRLGAQRAAYLREHGVRIETKFQGVELNTSLRVNGASPYRVVTQWQDPASSELHLFRSENLWFDPSDYIKGRQITVFIEPGNPKKYAVDVSFLPKLAS